MNKKIKTFQKKNREKPQNTIRPQNQDAKIYKIIKNKRKTIIQKANKKNSI